MVVLRGVVELGEVALILAAIETALDGSSGRLFQFMSWLGTGQCRQRVPPGGVLKGGPLSKFGIRLRASGHCWAPSGPFAFPETCPWSRKHAQRSGVFESRAGGRNRFGPIAAVESRHSGGGRQLDLRLLHAPVYPYLYL
jgi:hypothetical protein